jgi:hypothetical protein
MVMDADRKDNFLSEQQVFFAVGKNVNEITAADADQVGYVNQHGLSRKVTILNPYLTCLTYFC